MSGGAWTRLDDLSRDGDRIRARIELDDNSPWFNGHFHGQPILPGVALLVFVQRALRETLGQDLRLSKVSRVRFLALVRPGARLELQVDLFERAGELEGRFVIQEKDICFARGRLLFDGRRPGS